MLQCNIISEEANFASNQLMNNYLLMIYNNQTLEEISLKYNDEDFIKFIFSKLSALYELDKYTNYIIDVLKLVESNMFYDCSDFYDNLDSDFLEKLKKKFDTEEKKLMYSMWFFCEWSNIMIFHNFKTVYSQLFVKVKTSMENFQNNKYNDIIEFIDNNDVDKNEITFLIVYYYIMDIMYENIKSSIMLMDDKMNNNITLTILSSLAVLLFIIFMIYFVYIRNVNNDCKKLIHVSKIFKICKINV